MADAPALTAKPAADLPFEQAIFARSPLGPGATALLIFAVPFGTFLLIAAAEGVTTFRRAGGGFVLSGGAWSAFVLSLLCCAALGMQRQARLAEARDAPRYARILTGGMASARDVTSLVPREARYLRATLIGGAIGLGLSFIILLTEIRESHLAAPFTMLWFAAATTFMAILFARGVEQTRAGNRGYARTLNAELKIDLLRTDTLSVLGRSAARSALIWFVISAISCLFFVGGDLNWLTVLLALACAAIGVGHFAAVMGRIHRQIATAKAAELEHVRRRIDLLRASLHEDAFASASLHGLLAYEKRVLEAPEWPFDQTTAVRVGASALILTVPWFGQAVAAYLVEHLGRG
ncbi:MAG TPA: hypothetical protein VGB91_07510 [Rhizomicrobium sp.]